MTILQYPAGDGARDGADARPAAALGRRPGVQAAWEITCRDTQAQWELFELAEKPVDFEDCFRRGRFNNVTTVERVIGLKRGTAGTSGAGYLRRMLEVELFPELWHLRTAL